MRKLLKLLFKDNKKSIQVLTMQGYIDFIESHGYKITVCNFEDHNYISDEFMYSALKKEEMEDVLKNITIYKTMKTIDIEKHLKQIRNIIVEYERMTVLNPIINELSIKK